MIPGIAAVDRVSPSVSITAPGAGSTQTGTITLSANAADNDQIAGVQFYVDGSPVGAEDTVAPFSTTLNTAALTTGSHSVYAIARDRVGNLTQSATVSFNAADQHAPTISLTNPTGGSISGSITMTATVADDVGVVGVQFKIDGANVGAEAGVVGGVASTSLDTHFYANGGHTFSAVARDAAGNTTTASASASIANSAPASGYQDLGDWPGGRIFLDENHVTWDPGSLSIPATTTYYQCYISLYVGYIEQNADGSTQHVQLYLGGGYFGEILATGYNGATQQTGYGLYNPAGQSIHFERFLDPATSYEFAGAQIFRLYYFFSPIYAS